MTPDNGLQGRTCLITGASSGIGKETAVGLAQMGATVVMTARDEGRGRAAQSEIQNRSGESVDLLLADLASLDAVRRLVREFRDRYESLHLLINNAGAYNAQRLVTEDGYEMTLAVNHLAHFLLTNLLLDRLKASAPARIINVSSGAHVRATMDFDDLHGKASYRGMTAYGQSKLANVLFTKELARRLDGTGVTANCVHPGVVRTGFGKNSRGLSGVALRAFYAVAAPLLLNPRQGAETSIYLASSPDVTDVTGEYFVKQQVVASSELSNNADVARRLWDVSEELIRPARPA